MSGKTCEICGKPSGMYPLCISCLKEKEKGTVIKCEKCKKWHRINEPCDCEPVKAEKEAEQIIKKCNKCIICGKEAGDKYFCKECYFKHKDHTIILKVINCKEFEVEEKYADGIIYVCKDGHKVRSSQEKIIDDYLFDNKISHAYEKPIPVSFTEEIKPDFYLNELDIYIEHYGFDSVEHKKEKEYKNKFYKDNGITVIYTNQQDIENIELNLTKKLKYFEKGKINFDK